MTGVSVTVDDAEVTRALRAMAARLGDMRPAMELIGQAMVTEKDLGFRAETDPWGNSWAKLSAVTMGRRRGTSAQILRDTGIMQNSITFDAGKNSVVVGTNEPRARTHQFGAKMGEYGRYSQLSRRTKYKQGDYRREAGTKKGFPIPWGDIPRRAFLPLDKAGNIAMPQDQVQDILAILRGHLERHG